MGDSFSCRDYLIFMALSFFSNEWETNTIYIDFISCIIESYIYSYLLDFTKKNLITAIVYHVTWNLFLHIFAINPTDNYGSLLPYTSLVFIEVLILIIFFLVKKHIYLTR